MWRNGKIGKKHKQESNKTNKVDDTSHIAMEIAEPSNELGNKGVNNYGSTNASYYRKLDHSELKLEDLMDDNLDLDKVEIRF